MSESEVLEKMVADFACGPDEKGSPLKNYPVPVAGEFNSLCNNSSSTACTLRTTYGNRSFCTYFTRENSTE